MSNTSSYLLAIETVGHFCGIALADVHSGIIVKESLLEKPNMHDAMLAEMIRDAMNDLHINTKQIQAIAVSEGPGSFTGVRIGMSFAKGWCADGNTMLISVPTFDAMIHGFIKKYPNHSQKNIAIIMKSHGNAWFVQTFDRSGETKSNIAILSQHEIQSILDDETIVLGDYVSMIEKSPYPEFRQSHPQHIAALGYIMLQDGKSINPALADSKYHADFTPTVKGEQS